MDVCSKIQQQLLCVITDSGIIWLIESNCTSPKSNCLISIRFVIIWLLLSFVYCYHLATVIVCLLLSFGYCYCLSLVIIWLLLSFFIMLSFVYCYHLSTVIFCLVLSFVQSYHLSNVNICILLSFVSTVFDKFKLSLFSLWILISAQYQISHFLTLNHLLLDLRNIIDQILLLTHIHLGSKP